MPDETKVFIEQLSEKLRGIARQLDAALKVIKAGRGKLDNLLKKQFLGSEFEFMQGIGTQIQTGLDSKTLQVGTTIPICRQILDKVNLIKKIKIGGVEVNNDILKDADRSDNVKDRLADIAVKAAEMAKDKGGKSGKKKDLVKAIDDLRKALMEEMKKGLGVSKEVADEMGLPEDASPEQVEKAKTDYINNTLADAGLTAAFGLTAESEKVKKVVATLGDNLAGLKDKTNELTETETDEIAKSDDIKTENPEIATGVLFLGLTNSLQVFDGSKFPEYNPLKGTSREETKTKVAKAIKDKIVERVDTAIANAKDDADSAKADDLDVLLGYLGFSGKNLGIIITNFYKTEIGQLVANAVNYAKKAEGDAINANDLKNQLKTLKTDVISQAGIARDINIDVNNTIGEIEKVDKKAAEKILKAYGDIADADSADSLDEKVKVCEDIIKAIIDKVDTKGSTVKVGGFDDLFG